MFAGPPCTDDESGKALFMPVVPPCGLIQVICNRETGCVRTWSYLGRHKWYMIMGRLSCRCPNPGPRGCFLGGFCPIVLVGRVFGEREFSRRATPSMAGLLSIPCTMNGRYTLSVQEKMRGERTCSGNPSWQQEENLRVSCLVTASPVNTQWIICCADHHGQSNQPANQPTCQPTS